MTIEVKRMPIKAQLYIKKPIPIRAKQMFERFKVKTMEGELEGKPHDYLVEGIEGELYPCDKDIFEKSYEILPKEKK